MKKSLLVFLVLFVSVFNVFSQIVEKIFDTDEVKYKSGEPARFGPYGICVGEVNDLIEVMNGSWEGSNTFDFGGKLIEKSNMILPKTIECYQKIKNIYIGSYNTNVSIEKDSRFLAWVNTAESGISFILKKESGYIVYYIDKNGLPRAVDTEGKIYTNKEAIAYLKKYDSEKYEESLLRAEELGLKSMFENAEVLVWGKTYYKPKQYLLQYDENGLSYSFDSAGKWGTFVGCHLNDVEIMSMDNLNDFTTLIGIGKDYSTSWYVGFGGNIYYYIAGEEYTEVFRIRRTWGDPDFYAMAINGYTDDEYGKYVDEVLPKLSKSELRLLRNTVFALYGVHFKSEDLSKYYDKQVWYTDEGKSSSEITLPAHRQKLVEMILEMEK